MATPMQEELYRDESSTYQPNKLFVG